MRQKNIPLLIAMPLFLILWLAVALQNESPEQIVAALVQDVRNGKEHGHPLSPGEVETIRSFFRFASDRHLKAPEVFVREGSRSRESADVIATFFIVDYDQENRVRGMYDGSLLVVLKKKSWVGWEVESLRVLNKMKKQ